MRKFIFAVITIFALTLLINACKNSSTNPPVEVNKEYFPNGDGTTYTYSVEKTDSIGTQTAGTRNTEYNGTSVLSGTTYQVQIDSMNISGVGTVSFSYFRKNNNGVFYFLDTTGLSAYIPDTLRPYISIDTEMRELLFPLIVNSTWPVFKMSLHYAIFTITIIDVSAAYNGTENITLHLTSGDVNKSAVKVKYTLSLQIPDPNNLLSTISSSYNAYAWFVDGIGPVKWQGSGAILNAFSGSGVDLADTTTVVTQNLIAYSVK